jgi:hypothetical protein
MDIKKLLKFLWNLALIFMLKTKIKKTPLHWSACFGHKEIAKFFAMLGLMSMLKTKIKLLPHMWVL